MDTGENREFWRFVEETAREVEKWPAWKRSESVRPKPAGPTPPEQNNEPQSWRAAPKCTLISSAQLQHSSDSLRAALAPC